MVACCLSLSLPIPRSFYISLTVSNCCLLSLSISPGPMELLNVSLSVAYFLSTPCPWERNVETANKVRYLLQKMLFTDSILKVLRQSKSTNPLLLILIFFCVYTQLSSECCQGSYSLEEGLNVLDLCAAVGSAFY